MKISILVRFEKYLGNWVLLFGFLYPESSLGAK